MRAKLLLSLCILGLVVGTLFLFLHQPKPTPFLIQNNEHPTEIKQASSSQEIHIETVYTTAKTGPIHSIALLKQFIKSEPTYMNECHEIAHEVGHIAYEHFGEQAFSFKDPLCGAGYLHGLLEEATIFDETMSLTDIVHTVCPGDIEESCLHGLGHTIYKSTQNISEAINHCDKVRTHNKDCYDGVYMEVFDLESDDGQMSIATGAEICTASNEQTKSSCVFYLPRLLKTNEPGVAVTFCSTFVEEVDRLTCAQGSGVMFMKYATLFKIEAVIKNCALYSDEYLKQACTTGANNYYIYGNVTNTEW